MHYVFALFRYYPVLAVGLIVVAMQVAIFYRRRGSRIQYYWIAFGAILGLGLVAWIFFRGDLHSDQWARVFLGV